MTESTHKAGRNMLLVSSAILASRCLGLIRDITFAQVWGTDMALAAFILAFTIPNLFRSVLGEGGMNAAFVPIFNEKLQQEGPTEAWTTACRIMSVIATLLTGIIALLIVIILLLSPFFSDSLAGKVMELLPWLLPYAVLICLATGFGSVLNSIDRFGVPAFSQTLMNVSLIIATLLTAFAVKDSGGQVPIFPLAAAVIIAGVIQLAIHIFACAGNGWIFRFRPVFTSPEVRRFAFLIAPVVIGTGVVQLNVLVDRVLAGYLGNVATTTLYYSQRLVYLPVGLFGVSMGMVSMPAMSRAWTAGDTEALEDKLHFAFKQVFFLTIPVMILLYVLRAPLIQLLFERGAFTPRDTWETAGTLVFYSLGIPAFVGVKIAQTPYYAAQNTKTPVKIAVFCMVLNLVLNLILMQFLEQGGLAFATSICSWMNLALLLFFVRSYFNDFELKKTLFPVSKMLAAGIVSGIAASWSMTVFDPATGFALLDKILILMPPLLVGGVIYLLLAFVLRCDQLKSLLGKS
ncbi:MAG: murein biosynthesis integral membrane protein MurJ [Verrucomicrobiota bacterium]